MSFDTDASSAGLAEHLESYRASSVLGIKSFSITAEAPGSKPVENGLGILGAS